MRMERPFAVLVAGAAAFVLTACGDDRPPAGGDAGIAVMSDGGIPVTRSDGGGGGGATDGGPSCPFGAEANASLCTDGCDNDGDGRVDCDDFGCDGVAACGGGGVDAGPSCPTGSEANTTYCADGCDNDGDGQTDCADTGCAGIGSCSGGGTDAGPSCPTGSEANATYCADGCDNDGDGQTDCADTGCAGIGSCPAPMECSPGETRCSGGGLETCNSSGHWPGLVTSCSYGCNTAGGAHCNECTPSTTTCNGSGNVVRCGSDGRSTIETCSRGCYDGACLGPRTITIVNDLYNMPYGDADWPKWNKIHRVRIGLTESAVTGGSGERLGYRQEIDPGGTRCASSSCTETFSTESLGTDYWVYIQNGWWEYFCTDWGCSWTQHSTAVMCCDCRSTCYKWATVRVTGHAGGDLQIRASDFLSDGNWCRSSFC